MLGLRPRRIHHQRGYDARLPLPLSLRLGQGTHCSCCHGPGILTSKAVVLHACCSCAGYRPHAGSSSHGRCSCHRLLLRGNRSLRLLHCLCLLLVVLMDGCCCGCGHLLCMLLSVNLSLCLQLLVLCLGLRRSSRAPTQTISRATHWPFCDGRQGRERDCRGDALHRHLGARWLLQRWLWLEHGDG